MAEHSGSLRVIIAAIAGNVAIAICKFSAALVTGSAAMYSEAIHSTVDTGNELLLLFGMRRADKPPDAEHPFGYGLQLYFWVFVVAVMIFGLGALVAFYEGVEKILHAEPARYVVVNYIVLGASIVFEAGSWFVAFREFRHQRGRPSGGVIARRAVAAAISEPRFQSLRQQSAIRSASAGFVQPHSFMLAASCAI